MRALDLFSAAAGEAIGRAILRTEAALAAVLRRDIHHRGDQL